MIKVRKILYILLGVAILLYLINGLLFPEPLSLPVLGVINTYFWLVMIVVGTICAIGLSFLISLTGFIVALIK